MNLNNLKKIIAVVGTTCTGKSFFAHDLAKKINTEIISADSRLIYKNLDIGTAKPNEQELLEIKYHLVNILEPSEKEFSLADYLSFANPVIQSLLEQNKTPIVVGGTGLYLRGLLENINLINVPPDEKFRKSVEKISTEDLYKKLAESKKTKIHWNDRFRIIRALEIQKTDNKTFSVEQTERYKNILWIGLNYKNRELLRAKIKNRTIEMLEKGILKETENLIAKYGKLDLFNKTIGYKECIEFLEGNIKSKEELIEKIWISTCQYAKRQMTWFRTNTDIQWLDPVEDQEKLDSFKFYS